MASAPDLPTACPSCGAAVRTAVAWCGLCFAALVPAPAEAAEVAASEPVTERIPEQATRRGRHSRDEDHEQAGADTGPDADTAVPPSDADADLVADRLLAELAATRDPRPAWMGRLPTSTGGRVALVGGGVAVGTLLLVAVMSVLGLFL